MSAQQRVFCSQLARRREDPLIGSAPFCRTWVLIEYRDAWPFNGFDGLELDPEVKTAINDAAARFGARILLIRRHGRRIDGGTARWAVLRYHDSGAYRQHWGHWVEERDLLEIPNALASPGQTSLSPVILVCTHGVHDACCAVWGRPVSAALSEMWPHAVWESSHLGGDRFAPNVAVLPDGVYYGRMDPDAAITVLEDHFADTIGASNLRGYTTVRPVEQAAIREVLRRNGPAGRQDITVARTRQVENAIEVELAVVGLEQAVTVRLASRRSEPDKLTCRGVSNAVATYWEPIDVMGLPES